MLARSLLLAGDPGRVYRPGIGIVATFDIDCRLQQGNEWASRWFCKNRYIINTGQRRQHFGPFCFRYQWSPRPFEQAHTGIIIEAEN